MRRRNAIPRNDREEQARERALAVLALKRRQNISLRKAAISYETTPNTVIRYVGSALVQEGPGKRYRATKYDRLVRTLNATVNDGPQPVTVRDSRTATRIAEHSNAVKQFIRGRDHLVLDPFVGKSFKASGKIYYFVTDTKELERLGDADALPENLYRLGNG